MQPTIIGKIRPTIRYKFWLRPGQGQGLEDVIAKAEELGNTIIELDTETESVLVAEYEEAGVEVWGCRLCLAAGTITIVGSEGDLTTHLDEEHAGWRQDEPE